MLPPRMKKHRLPEAAYYGRKTVSFTACELHRRPHLADPSVVKPCVEILGRAASEYACIVPIYTLMPDHLHVMIMGLEDQSRPKAAMARFKHLSAMWLYNHRPDIAWQDDFYDRIIRGSNGWPNHVRYIALNPIRAGPCQNIEDWPFICAIGTTLDDILDTTT